MKTISKNLVIAILILSACALILSAGCSERLVNNHRTTSLKISIGADQSFDKSTVIEIFGVLVTDPETSDTIAVGELFLFGAFLEGVVDSLPVGVPLLFTVQAMNLQDTVIYAGSVVAALSADQQNLIEVPMRPVVPMMKLTPRHFEFANLTQQAKFFVDAVVFNVDSMLYGTSFRLSFDEAFIWLDSVVVNPVLAADSVIFFHNYVDTTGLYYSVSISETDITKQLVDINGDGVLARFYFSTAFGDVITPIGPTTIGLQLTGMASVDQRIIDIKTVYTDDCQLDFVIAVPDAPACSDCLQIGRSLKK